jgi:hypothetical protein
MFTVEVYAVVRHFVCVEGNCRREAALALGLHRETVLILAPAGRHAPCWPNNAGRDRQNEPHLPKTSVKTISAADCAVLIPG